MTCAAENCSNPAAKKGLCNRHYIRLRRHGHHSFGKRLRNLESARSENLAEYKSWDAMVYRCADPDCDQYEEYGGRGITVCREWAESFDAFLSDMGPKPSALHTIDRIDNDGNYERANCRWATRKQQANNRRNTRRLKINGTVVTFSDLEDAYGISANTIKLRVDRYGWSLEAAVSTPSRRAERAS